jgi:hypothetical protein
MFKKVNISKESELENLLVKDPDSLEQGLKILTHQHRANGNFIDVLAADMDGVLVVIELKIGEDNEMLLQALDYYDYVSSNLDRLANEYQKVIKINVEEDPRIILVASHFTDRLKKAARYFKATIDLREYSYLETKTGERGLNFNEVPFDSDSEYAPAESVENIMNYINESGVKTLCLKVHKEILKLGSDIEIRPRSHIIRYWCKNHVLGGLDLRKKFFYPYWKLPNGDYPYVTITKSSDWSKRREKVLNAFTKRYRLLGGEE